MSQIEMVTSIKNKKLYCLILGLFFCCFKYFHDESFYRLATQLIFADPSVSAAHTVEKVTELKRDRGWLYPVRGNYSRVAGYKSLKENLAKIVPSCCNLMHINILGRHSTRYRVPFLYKNDSLIEMGFVPSVKDALIDFAEKVPMRDALTERGREEWTEIAKRLKQLFPAFLNFSKLKQRNGIIVEHELFKRNIESGFWYAHQLLQMDQITSQDPKLRNLTPSSETPEYPVRLMQKYLTFRFETKYGYKSCRNFLKIRSRQLENFRKLLKSDSYLKQQAELLTGKYCSNPNCTLDTVHLAFLHDVCGYQFLLHSNDSLCYNWPIKILEKIAYATNVRKYYDSSYGTGLAENFGCAISHVIIEDMERAINGWTPSHVVRIVTQETILPLLTIGKVFPKEDRLNWTGIPDNNFDTSFRVNLVTPMTANVIFLVYDCSSCDRNGPRFHVLTLLNERVVKTPFYAADYLIPFERFVKNFQPCTDKEKMEKCENNR